MAARAELEDQQTRQPRSRQDSRRLRGTPQRTRPAVDRRSDDPRPCGRRDEPGRHSRLDGHGCRWPRWRRHRSSAPRRSTLCTSAVANRRLGPTSSAVISTLDRWSPSSVSHVRCSSRPVTTTRIPLVRLERHVLGQVPPADDVEERCRLLPFLGRPVLPAAVDRHAQLGGRLALSGVADLRFPGQVADDRRGVRHVHPSLSSRPRLRGRDGAWRRRLAANLARNLARRNFFARSDATPTSGRSASRPHPGARPAVGRR